ncbi:hypothetical protein PWT90_01124 [Aphanocladium album]|nr:hypothetical protein PWT90_01124 [Aphanocladium album]
MLASTLLSLVTLGLASTAVAQDHILVTGIATTQGRTVPVRQNINDLQSAGGPAWDLYVQAVASLQKMSQQDRLGWFQVMAIHGQPFMEYDNAGPRQKPEGTRAWGGYCPHGELVFLPWHRPYVMLYEQALSQAAVAIAETYPEKTRATYRAAARALRSPYWDWSADSNIPGATVPLNLTVNGPKGAVSIQNPLQTYIFPKELTDGKYGGFDVQKRPQIYRCRAPSAYPKTANAKLAARDMKSNVYAAFTQSTTFEEFASQGNNGVGLEFIHNWIHSDATCGEQLLNLALSAFDPLFMLHHTNVDRLWAYWQYIKPAEGVFGGSYAGQARWATPEGTTITTDSVLEPFYRTQTEKHTSKTVLNLNGLGYTYDGLEYWRMNAEQLRKAAVAKVNTLYGPPPAEPRRNTPEERRATAAEKTTQYFVRLEVDREQVDRPSSLAVFIDGQKAGDLAVMELPVTGTMKSGFCVDKLVQAAVANNDTAASIAESKISVSVVKPDGSSVPASHIPSLKVVLHEVTVTPAKSVDEFPTVSPATIYKVNVTDYA